MKLMRTVTIDREPVLTESARRRKQTYRGGRHKAVVTIVMHVS